MRRAIVIQTIGSSIVAHHNHINVRKVVTPTSPPHHFDRPKMPITIEPQWMPWCIALRRLLAIPKLKKVRRLDCNLFVHTKIKCKSLPGTSHSALLHWALAQTNALVP